MENEIRTSSAGLNGQDRDHQIKTVIRMKNIRKSFTVGKQKTEVLKGVNLQIQQGEMVAIMGPSGCGKSTLLNLIGCIDTADSGTFYLNERKILKEKEKTLASLRNNIFGYIIQDFALISEDTVWENIMLPLDYSKKRIDKKDGDTYLKKFGLSELKKTRASLLSGGEQQRVAIVRALMNRPEIILADEPTGALDSATGEVVMKILRDICNQGKTILVVTHDEKVAKACDRIIYMEDGVTRC